LRTAHNFPSGPRWCWRRLTLLQRLIRLAARVFSLGFGLFLVWKAGTMQSLLR
jgi:hypothetical protein